LKLKGPILQDRLRSADKKEKDRKELATSNGSRAGAMSGSNSKLGLRQGSPSTDQLAQSSHHVASIDKMSQDDRQSAEEPTPRIQSLAQMRDQKKNRESNKVLHQEDAGGLERRLAAIVTQLD
jgi:hypothetical protein